MPLYPHPLSPGYWRSAAGELKALRRLVFMALMIAACIVLSHCSIRLGESLSLSVTFLARALCSLVCGPLAVIVFGAAEDTLSFFLSSGGYPYFPGYMLTTITGCFARIAPQSAAISAISTQTLTPCPNIRRVAAIISTGYTPPNALLIPRSAPLNACAAVTTVTPC